MYKNSKPNSDSWHILRLISRIKRIIYYYLLPTRILNDGVTHNYLLTALFIIVLIRCNPIVGQLIMYNTIKIELPSKV